MVIINNYVMDYKDLAVKIHNFENNLEFILAKNSAYFDFKNYSKEIINNFINYKYFNFGSLCQDIKSDFEIDKVVVNFADIKYFMILMVDLKLALDLNF